MPLWFPFALVASFLVMLGSGSKAGWKLPADQPKPPPPPLPPPQSPPVQGRAPLMAKGDWPYPGLPHRVTLEGRLFEKARRWLPELHEPHAIYEEVRGPGKLVVLSTKRFVAVG
jgi:hypothetical protein